MKKSILFSFLLLSSACIHAQNMPSKSTERYKPKVERVIPAKQYGQTPSDAIVLFDGKNLDEWTNKQGEASTWVVEDGIMHPIKGSGEIRTRRMFGDCQLHIEFKAPKKVTGKGQTKGNSGVFLHGIYELQILDGDDNPTYVNGMVGSLYKQQAPLVNAYTNDKEWQVYDIFWKAPRFGTNDVLESPAMITVLLNGVLIQNNYILKGTTPNSGFPVYSPHGRLPLMLQDHGEEVQFKNIWIRDLE